MSEGDPITVSPGITPGMAYGPGLPPATDPFPQLPTKLPENWLTYVVVGIVIYLLWREFK